MVKAFGGGFAIATDQTNGTHNFFLFDPTTGVAVDMAAQGAPWWPTFSSEVELRDGRLAYIANNQLFTVTLSGELVEHAFPVNSYGIWGVTGMSLYPTSRGLVSLNIRAFFLTLQ